MTFLKDNSKICPNNSWHDCADETLTCLAEWTDDRDVSQTFLLGTLDTRYRRTTDQRVRCFLLRKERLVLLINLRKFNPQM